MILENDFMGKQKAKSRKKIRSNTPSAHLPRQAIEDLTEKIINAVDVQEKVRWSWGIMHECQVVQSLPALRKHIEGCENCRDFFIARKALAELIIQAGRI